MRDFEIHLRGNKVVRLRADSIAWGQGAGSHSFINFSNTKTGDGNVREWRVVASFNAEDVVWCAEAAAIIPENDEPPCR